jgi:hypothetical protein
MDPGALSLRFDPPLLTVTFWRVCGALVDTPAGAEAKGSKPVSSFDGVVMASLDASILPGPEAESLLPVVLTGWRPSTHELRPQVFLPSDHAMRPLAPVTVVGCAGVTLIPLSTGADPEDRFRHAAVLIEKGRRVRG